MIFYKLEICSFKFFQNCRPYPVPANQHSLPSTLCPSEFRLSVTGIPILESRIPGPRELLKIRPGHFKWEILSRVLREEGLNAVGQGDRGRTQRAPEEKDPARGRGRTPFARERELIRFDPPERGPSLGSNEEESSSSSLNCLVWKLKSHQRIRVTSQDRNPMIVVELAGNPSRRPVPARDRLATRSSVYHYQVYPHLPLSTLQQPSTQIFFIQA